MKKIISLLLTIVSLLSLSSCNSRRVEYVEIPPEIAAEPIVDVVLRYSTELKYEKNLYLMDSKIVHDELVQKIRLDYVSQDIVTLCEAREILVDITEGFLARLNAMPGAREQTLKRFFTPYNLDICIHYDSDFIDYVDFMYVSWVTLRNGKSAFYAGDVNTYRLDTWHSRYEPYYKTRQFVRISRDAEEHYLETHKDLIQDKFFGKDIHEPANWISSP